MSDAVECTLQMCKASATEVVHFESPKWPQDAQDFPFCSEHIDDRAAALRQLGAVQIRRV